MMRWLGIVVGTLGSAVRTHRELALENLALRQQLAVWKARQPRPRLTESDRIFWVLLSRLWTELAAFVVGGPAADGDWLAPPGISTLLGVEESATIRSACDRYGAARSNSANEPRQSSVGCATDSRRAAEARPGGLAGDGVEVHASVSAPAVTGVADVFEESRRRSHGVGFLHGADGDVSGAIRARPADPQPAPVGAFQCDGAPDRGMDGAPTARGVRTGGGAAVSDSGPRSRLWRTIFVSGRNIGNSGSGNCASVAVAKRLCGAGHWFDSTGMPRPHRCNRRATSSSDPVAVRRLLQSDADALSPE